MSEALANQIAAGEVVERPASCVKELVENSFDAGARHVSVAIEEGGIRSIVVQDDGCGMDEEDAVLAFARHATSKLLRPQDLFSIRTLGFRGEALASIAAVARVVLRTRPADREGGVEVRVEGTNRVEGPRPVGMPPGTRIEVRDLFFNTPARLKYLRTVATEQARILEVVQRLALGRPEVAVSLMADGRRLFQSGGRGERLEVLAAIYGTGEAGQFLPVCAESPDYRVTGYIGRPTQARASRHHGYLYVNGRTIRSPGLHQAVVAGYGPRLMVGRHPVYVIAVEMDPRLVDVNIHPHKSEVRFSEERDLAALVARAVEGALEQAALAVSLARRQPRPRPAAVQQALPLERVPRHPVAAVAESLYGAAPVRHASAPSVRERVEPPPASEAENVTENQPEAGGPTAEEAVRLGGAGGQEGQPGPWLQRLRLVGQALGTYIIAEDGEHLYIIDQHAAHERVLYERFSERLRAREVQPVALLSPLPLDLAPRDMARLWEHRRVLGDFGLQVEEFGTGHLLVRSVPDVWEGLDVRALLEALAADLHLPDGGDVYAVVADRIALQACKAAVKANHRMSEPELTALLEALAELPDPFHCPHGRPIVIRLSNRDLEKGFRRIV
ncbi:MAG: DNA mismatch repair endonuclease MutL [Alicyclobacillaceae bacterium]|nr:DNA mismatch repair endonuclease MutL [Alicyclobacillaceae bacterium]